MNVALNVGGTQLSQEEVNRIYSENLLIVNYSGVHQIFYSSAQEKYYWNTIVKTVGLTAKGRFHLMTPEDVNSLLN